MTFAKLYKARR